MVAAIRIVIDIFEENRIFSKKTPHPARITLADRGVGGGGQQGPALELRCREINESRVGKRNSANRDSRCSRFVLLE